ncbi:DNA repair protein [Ferrimonas aestuarii]|uniref:DNA repair protein n=1 Tax=Ferrimonas aestuarii TaxID=2569539 RepID=A0A4U1BKQ2_9GAMM|nr:DNA repair protein [Ferrimonas aestuarii]TKB52750.1 DNA repair protein [Ferrimonas aestuarii]
MLGRLGSWAASKVSRAVDKIKDTVSEVADKVKNKAQKAWHSFTGENTARKAERLYKQIKTRYDQARSDYEKDSERITESIRLEIEQVNQRKQEIYDCHFNRFVRVAKRLHNVTVKGQPFEEFFDKHVLEIKGSEGIRHERELITINFDEFSWTRVASYLFTLGFHSRKQAKESLKRVEEEEARINEEIRKMQSHLVVLKTTLKAIQQVQGYFDELVGNYSALLDRFEYGIQSQRHLLLATGNVMTHRLDFRQIPIAHIEEFHALFNLSIVLNHMSNQGYLSDEGLPVDADIDSAKTLYQSASKLAVHAA